VRGVEPSPPVSTVPFKQTFRGKDFYVAIGFIGAFGVFGIYKVINHLDKRFTPLGVTAERRKLLTLDLEKKQYLLKVIESYHSKRITENQTRVFLEMENLYSEEVKGLLGIDVIRPDDYDKIRDTLIPKKDRR